MGTERSDDQLLALLEAILFVSPEPVSLDHLAYALGETRERIAMILDVLAADYTHSRHGLMLRTIAGGYQLATKPEHSQELRDIVENLPPPAPLSKSALETAAIIAYKQPITAAEVESIRGVQNRETIRTLLKRKLIAPAGRSTGRGHAIQYRTTRRFLNEFGLRSLDELPSLDALQQRGSPFIDPEG